MLSILNWNSMDESEKSASLLRCQKEASASQTQKVKEILYDVKANKDLAIKKYTSQFDKIQLEVLKVDPQILADAWKTLPLDLKQALTHAKNNIQSFHELQKIPIDLEKEIQPGVYCRRKKIPLETVGLYIPGGSAPLFSTLLMTAIPALIAKVKNIVVCSPPTEKKIPHSYILATAHLLELENVYSIGGVQAIAAMAYGTESIPPVDKIFGPGNSWVTAAKTLVAQEVSGLSIDMPAGPSEVLVIADSKASPVWLAWDLLSQLEHGEDSQAILISDDRKILEATKLALLEITEKSLRKTILQKSLNNVRLIFVQDILQAIYISNLYAPEHLILNVQNEEHYVNKIQNAGSVFLGAYAPESMGDYASGTNHVLPTAGYARSYSGLNLDAFMKSMTLQKITPTGLLGLASTVETMAYYEGLEAHQMAVQVRRLELERHIL